MGGLGVEIVEPQIREGIAPGGKLPAVPGQSGGIAGHIGEKRRALRSDPPGQGRRKPLPGRVFPIISKIQKFKITYKINGCCGENTYANNVWIFPRGETNIATKLMDRIERNMYLEWAAVLCTGQL
jgi:hypothetical protein